MKTVNYSIVPSVPTRTLAARFNQMKVNVRRQLSQEFRDVIPVALIRRAVDEAAQTADGTGFPHLVFPVLAEETVRRMSSLFGDGEAEHVESSSRGDLAVCA